MQEQPNKDGKALTAGKIRKCRQKTFFIIIIFCCLSTWCCKLYRDTGDTQYGNDSSSVRTFDAKLFTERKL